MRIGALRIELDVKWIGSGLGFQIPSMTYCSTYDLVCFLVLKNSIVQRQGTTEAGHAEPTSNPMTHWGCKETQKTGRAGTRRDKRNEGVNPRKGANPLSKPNPKKPKWRIAVPQTRVLSVTL